MREENSMPWHRRSFERFVYESLPELLAQRLPLAGYHAEPTGTYACRISVIIAAAGKHLSVTYEDVPQPDAEGVFEIDGRCRIVHPTASDRHLERAEIRCVGEQLLDYLDAQLGKAPTDLDWDESLVRSFLPLDQWVRELLRGDAGAPVNDLNETNWLARQADLRRLVIDKSPEEILREPYPPETGRRGRVITAGQFGRTCPFETPEGTNVGRVLHLALGAEIRDGRIIVTDDRPGAALGLTASMVPFMEHDDGNRLLMGVNMMRQWLTPPDPEPALVQSGNEPDAPGFWCGRDLLTAFIPWGVNTYEDALVISGPAAQRLGYPQALEPGDKLSNRHGQKGVVSRILADRDMPHLQDGTPVELLCSSMGLHTRLNYGQVREAVMGRVAKRRGERVIVAPFQAPSDEDMRRQLLEAGLPETGMEVLKAGRGGEPLRSQSTVGWVYWGKTSHLASDKFRVYVTPPGGMRQGAMEYMAMRDAEAYASIADRFALSAQSRDDAEALVERVANGSALRAVPPTSPCKQLFRRMAMASVRSEFRDSRVAFRFATPPEPRLKLTLPVRHPWQGDRELAEIGILEGDPAYARLTEANSRLKRMLASEAPKGVIERAVNQLQASADEYLDALVRPEHLQLEDRLLFSGRAVIAPGEDLSVEQAALPEEMAWTLFGPLVVRELAERQEVEKRTDRASQALDRIMARSWVIINRAPTLAPTCLVAFRPVRDKGSVVRLHALVTPWMNADYDGDQVAVFLPLTEAAQREAGEKLSVCGHLRRDPSLIRWMVPHQEILWALADLSRTSEGRREIDELTGVQVSAPDGFVTRESFSKALKRVIERGGVDRVIEVVNRLARRGFELVRTWGASMNPFLGSAVKRPAIDADVITELVEGWCDFDDPGFGPQALAVKSGARGNVRQQVMLLGGMIIATVEGKLVPLQQGLCDGRTPQETLQAVVGAREGLAETARQALLGTFEFARAHYGWTPKGVQGYGVLARAMRSRRPGIVFAHAAATGEVDPLTDLDSRLFVGLPVTEAGA